MCGVRITLSGRTAARTAAAAPGGTCPAPPRRCGPSPERAQQRPLVDQLAARDVDQPRAALHRARAPTRRSCPRVSSVSGAASTTKSDSAPAARGAGPAAAPGPASPSRAPARRRRPSVDGVVAASSDAGGSRSPGTRTPSRARRPPARSTPGPRSRPSRRAARAPRAAATSAPPGARAAAAGARLTARIISSTYSAIGPAEHARARS